MEDLDSLLENLILLDKALGKAPIMQAQRAAILLRVSNLAQSAPPKPTVAELFWQDILYDERPGRTPSATSVSVLYQTVNKNKGTFDSALLNKCSVPLNYLAAVFENNPTRVPTDPSGAQTSQTLTPRRGRSNSS